MRRTLLALATGGLMIAVATNAVYAGVKRVEISPATLINLNRGHSGAFMGGAVTADMYFTRALALRTTVGFTKDRYFPATADYRSADYGLWLSLAPYLEANVGNRVRPYAALLGTFTSSNYGQAFNRQPLVGFDQSPIADIQSRNNAAGRTYYSLGVTLGSKFRAAGNVSIFAEVSHFFYSNIRDNDTFFSPETSVFGRPFDFERNPTYLSIGLSYGFDLKSSKN